MSPTVVEIDSIEAARAALADVRRRGCLAEIYSGDDLNKFSVGRVDEVTDRHVRLRSVDPEGRESGVEIRALRRVHRIETGSDYLERRLGPLTAHWRAHGPLWPAQRLTGDHPDLLLDALTVSLEDRCVVSVWMYGAEERQYTGPVVKLAEAAGAIAELDEFGDVEGEHPFRVKDIEALDLGCGHERIAQLLMGTV